MIQLLEQFNLRFCPSVSTQRMQGPCDWPRFFRISGDLTCNEETKPGTHGQKWELRIFEGCLTVHLSHEIIWNANLMQQGNFIDVFIARHVSGTYAHYQEH